MQAVLQRAAGSPRRWIESAVGVLFLTVATCLAAAGVLLGLGFRPLVVRSGSMEPAIRTGDLIFTRMVPARDIEPGDVVTFRDPSRSGELVTHRAISVRRAGRSIDVRTRGDANTGEESWSIDRTGRVGRYAFRVPGAGFVLAWIAHPLVRTVMLLGGVVLIGLLLLRRIWRK